MRNSVLVAALLFGWGMAGLLFGQASMPMLQAVEPASGTYGDVLVLTGTNLDQGTVAALYLTDGKNDTKVMITEQSATSIKFRIPAGIAKGRFALMILTQGKDAKFIEEPVKVTVEAPAVPPSS